MDQPPYPQGQPPFGPSRRHDESDSWRAYASARPFAPNPPVVSPERPYLVAPDTTGWILLVCAIAVVIGSFLPWATALGGLISKAGTAGDGVITLIIGFILVVLSILVIRRQGRRWVLISAFLLGLVVVIVAIADIGDVGNRAELSIGAGLIIVLLGGIAVSVVELIALANLRPRLNRVAPGPSLPPPPAAGPWTGHSGPYYMPPQAQPPIPPGGGV
jgi:hypothetical protein